MPPTTIVSAAAPAAAPLSVLVPAQPARAATRLPLTFANETGTYATTAIWAYVVGTDPNGRECFLRADGTCVPVVPELTGPDGFADLSIPLSNSGDTVVSLPYLTGRIYLSIEKKLKFQVVTDDSGTSRLRHPAGWVSSDPNYDVLYDCAEFDFGANGLVCGARMADLFSLPLVITLRGRRTRTTGVLEPGVRDAIFARAAARPEFEALVIGDRLRLLSPGRGAEAGLLRAADGSAVTSRAPTRGIAAEGVAAEGIAAEGGAAKGVAAEGIAAEAVSVEAFPAALLPAGLPADFAAQIQDDAPTALTLTLTEFSAGSSQSVEPAPILLSAGQPTASSSTRGPGYCSAHVVDGKADTHWLSSCSDPQWVSIDLGALHSVSRVVLRWEAAYGTAYQVQVSVDGDTWSAVHSTATGDGGMDDVSFPARSARYVRMFGNERGTESGYSLREFAVYGS